METRANFGPFLRVLGTFLEFPESVKVVKTVSECYTGVLKGY